jgi:hypothetical protein
VPASVKEGEAEGCRTLFAMASLHKLVMLAPVLAGELFLGRAARLGAFGTIQQAHVHAEIRLLGRNDERSSGICRGILRCLARHFVGALSSVRVEVPSHGSSRGEAR